MMVQTSTVVLAVLVAIATAAEVDGVVDGARVARQSKGGVVEEAPKKFRGGIEFYDNDNNKGKEGKGGRLNTG